MSRWEKRKIYVNSICRPRVDLLQVSRYYCAFGSLLAFSLGRLPRAILASFYTADGLDFVAIVVGLAHYDPGTVGRSIGHLHV